MMRPDPDILKLFEQANEYDLKGDPYNAVKLYKRVAKMAPEWAPPFAQLGVIYKLRREWKPALHYAKRAIAIDSSLQDSWWNLGIAATALKKWRLARNVWSKFGFSSRKEKDSKMPLVAVRLKYKGQFEILWAQRLDPARCIIRNIPHPDSGRRYLDEVLIDGKVSGYNVIRQKRYPVFDELDLFKSSSYHTFSTELEAASSTDIQQLEKLCRTAGIGFEVWSNASRQQSPQPSESLPEYYQNNLMSDSAPDTTHVAFAARRVKKVLQTLYTWQTITLHPFPVLERHL